MDAVHSPLSVHTIPSFPIRASTIFDVKCLASKGEDILGDLTFTHTHPMYPRMPCTPLQVRASSPASQSKLASSPASQSRLAPSRMSNATMDFFNESNSLSTSFSVASDQQWMTSSANYCRTSKSLCPVWNVSDKQNPTQDYSMHHHSMCNRL